MYDWITDHKIPVGRWIAAFITFLTDNFEWLFDAISLVLSLLINATTAGLLWVPPILLMVVLAAAAWLLHRSIWLAVFIFLGLLFIANLGYWERTSRRCRSSSGRRW